MIPECIRYTGKAGLQTVHAAKAFIVEHHIFLADVPFFTQRSKFLMFIIVGTYSRRVNVSGEVTTWPRAVNIYSGVQGFVVRQFVHEGQLIKKGILYI